MTLLSSAAADLALTDIPSPSATSPGAAQPADSPKPPTPIPRRSRPASLPRLRRRQQTDSSPGSRPTPALSAAPAPSEEASGPSGVGRGGALASISRDYSLRTSPPCSIASMTSLALARPCCSRLAAIFKLVGFGTSGVMGSQVSVQISSILSSRLNSLRFVRERPGEAEREWLVGREGGVLPKLKMAAASAAPRNLTSGFAAAGAAPLALAPAYGVGVRQRGASWKRPDWEAALGAGAASTPRLLATDLAGIVSERKETLRGKCLCAHVPIHPRFPTLLASG